MTVQEEHDAFLALLHGVRDARKEYRALVSRFAALDAASTRTTPNWGADGGHGGDSQNVWALRADAATLMTAAKEKMRKAEAELDALIALVPTKVHRRILRLRYLRCAAWPHICTILGYSNSYIYRLHKEALASAEAIWRENN